MGKAKDELASVIPILNQNPKAREIIRVMPKVIGFELDGEDGIFYLTVSGEQMKLEQEISGEPDMIISGDADEVAKIFTREREVTHPIAEGKIWVSKGNVSKVILLDRALNLQPRRK